MVAMKKSAVVSAGFPNAGPLPIYDTEANFQPVFRGYMFDIEKNGGKEGDSSYELFMASNMVLSSPMFLGGLDWKDVSVWDDLAKNADGYFCNGCFNRSSDIIR